MHASWQTMAAGGNSIQHNATQCNATQHDTTLNVLFSALVVVGQQVAAKMLADSHLAGGAHRHVLGNGAQASPDPVGLCGDVLETQSEATLLHNATRSFECPRPCGETRLATESHTNHCQATYAIAIVPPSQYAWQPINTNLMQGLCIMLGSGNMFSTPGLANTKLKWCKCHRPGGLRATLFTQALHNRA